MTRIVHVAVGVIVDSNEQILIAKRKTDSHQGGLWEFPGGKVECGETVKAALARELFEELNIHVTACEPFKIIEHDYGDKKVMLDIWWVTQFTGEPVGAEGQQVCWVKKPALNDYAFPAANRPIISALALPKTMLITGSAFSVEAFLNSVKNALENGIRLVQLRVVNQTFTWQEVLQPVKVLCLQYGALLQLNIPVAEYCLSEGVGLHLNRHELMAIVQRPVADNVWLGASCHNAAEIAKAQLLGVDYILLSPIFETASHPNQPTLGVEGFAALCQQSPLTVFALGGVDESSRVELECNGAHGIAGISGWWK